MQIKVAYTATLEEYYHADEAFRQALNKSSVDLYVQIALWLIAIAFMAIGQFFLGGIIAVIAFILHQGYAKRWIVRRNFYKMLNAGELETLTFSEEKIIYECGMVAEVITWDDYAAYLETDELFMVFYDASDHYMIIPKRALKDDAEIDQLRQLCVRQLANYEVTNV